MRKIKSLRGASFASERHARAKTRKESPLLPVSSKMELPFWLSSVEDEVRHAASITTLSHTDDDIFKFAAAAEAKAGRPHQPRPDRPQRLFPRHTKSFFWRGRG